MKRNVLRIFFAFLPLIFAVSSCKKDSGPFKESTIYDENIINVMAKSAEINEYSLQDLQTFTEETQKLIFDELTIDNKVRIWRERVDLAIEQQTDDSKIAALNELKALITQSVFADGDDRQISNWVESRITLFGYDETKSIVTTMGGTGTDNLPHVPPGNDAQSGCKCSQRSDWCFHGTCKKEDCLRSRWGCGTVWNNPCNGRCQMSL